MGQAEVKFFETAEVSDGYIVAFLTDELVFQYFSKENLAALKEKQRKVLEIYLFNKTKEIKLFRNNIGENFQMRIADDAENYRAYIEAKDYIDENQFLDIDEARSEKLFTEKGMVRATGGGMYELPAQGYHDTKIKVRNYIDYTKDCGMAYVSDWRLVEVVEGGNE